MCRTLDNTGFVTAVYRNQNTNGSTQGLRFLKTDLSGTIQSFFDEELTPPNSGPSNRMELMKLMPWPQENSYLLLGAIHQTGSSNIVGSFLLKIDGSFTSITDAKLFPTPRVIFWDFDIAPLTGRPVVCGMKHDSIATFNSSRQGFIQVLNNNLTPLNAYEFPVTALPVGTLQNRFDNIKAIDITTTGGNEYINVAGNFSRLYSGNYHPAAFCGRFQLTTAGVLNGLWFKTLMNTPIDQFIPADLSVDESNNRMMVIGSLSPNIGINEASYWVSDLAGNGLRYGQFEGFVPPVHELRPYQIELMNNGNFKIAGWAHENLPTTPPQINKFNFFEISYNYTNDVFSDLKVYFGLTDGLPTMYGNGMLGIDAQWTYTYNGTMTIHAYHCPRFFTSWWDGEAQQTAFVWVNKKNQLLPPINPLWQQMRLVSTTSTGPTCSYYTPSSYGEGTMPNQISIANPTSAALLMTDDILINLRNKTPIENPCDGAQD